MTGTPESFVADGRRWIARPGDAAAVRLAAGRLRELGEATLLKRSLSREVHRLELSREGMPGLIVKWHKPRGPLDKLKYLLARSRARVEWDVSHALEGRGIPAVRVIAFAEGRSSGGVLQDSVSLCEELPGAQRLSVALCDVLRQEKLLTAAVRLIARMHANGVEHTDLHAGNLLVSAGGELVVADLHAVNLGGAPSWSRRVACLAKFLSSIEAVLNQLARAAWIGQYGEEVGLGASARAQLASQVERKIERLRMQRFRSRTRRCLMNSSRFCLDKLPGRRIYRQRSIPLDVLAGLIGAHRADVRQHAPSVMSQRKRSAVTQQKLGHEDVCVKSFSVGGLVGRLSALAWRSRGKRAWIAANGLVARKVPTAEPLALVEELGWGESFLVTRYIRDAVPLKLWVRGPGAECPAASRRELIDAVAGVVRRLHEARVYADDLSAKNVLVRRAGSQWEAFIIDVDNTQLWRRLTWRRRLWNLAQLNDLTERVSPGERCRFLRAYAGPGWPLFRRDAKAIIELTRQRRERYRRRMDRIASRVPSAGACVIME